MPTFQHGLSLNRFDEFRLQKIFKKTKEKTGKAVSVVGIFRKGMDVVENEDVEAPKKP